MSILGRIRRVFNLCQAKSSQSTARTILVAPPLSWKHASPNLAILFVHRIHNSGSYRGSRSTNLGILHQSFRNVRLSRTIQEAHWLYGAGLWAISVEQLVDEWHASHLRVNFNRILRPRHHKQQKQSQAPTSKHTWISKTQDQWRPLQDLWCDRKCRYARRDGKPVVQNEESFFEYAQMAQIWAFTPQTDLVSYWEEERDGSTPLRKDTQARHR